MQKLFQKLHETIEGGEDAVLVTIVASSGSTPRGSGARMLVTREGRIAGTIGGGAVEFEAEKVARKALESKGSTREYFRLDHNEVADIGMICGGNVDVYFRYIPAGDAYVLDLTERIEELFVKDEQCWLITEVTEDNAGLLSVYSPKSGSIGAPVPDEVIAGLANKPARITVGEKDYYVERLVKAGRVYVFGGGHVSQQLVPLLVRCDFKCTVIEDRPEFADPALFEGKAETRLINMDDVADLVPSITADDYVCIMTRGHKDDYLVQAQMLRTPACYIGVIGSKHKIAGVNAKLFADGYTEADTARITTPIGLDILAETPAEIAVAIVAQMIEVRAMRNDSRKLKDRV